MKVGDLVEYTPLRKETTSALRHRRHRNESVAIILKIDVGDHDGRGGMRTILIRWVSPDEIRPVRCLKRYLQPVSIKSK